MENLQQINCGLICEYWNSEENNWFELFVESFHKADQIELIICLPYSNGNNARIIDQDIIKPTLNKYQYSAKIKILEVQDFTKINFDYLLENSTLKKYNNLLVGRYGIIKTPSLESFDQIYSKHFNSKNPYEYSFLVDSYDMKKKCKNILQNDSWKYPEQFGSTGGSNFKQLLENIVENCNINSSILEVGCGAGAFYNTLKINELNFQYTGIDLSRKQILRCKSNYPDSDFRVGNVCTLSFPDNHFDYVFENNVLIFTIDPLKAIKEMIRVSKKYVNFSIQLKKEGNGLYCYYPFTNTCKVNPVTKAIQVSDEEKRFFKNNVWYEPCGDHIKAMVVKAPVYQPSKHEFDQFIGELKATNKINVIKDTITDTKKIIWVNDNFTSSDIIQDDCVVTDDDRKLEINSVTYKCLLKTN